MIGLRLRLRRNRRRTRRRTKRRKRKRVLLKSRSKNPEKFLKKRKPGLPPFLLTTVKMKFFPRFKLSKLKNVSQSLHLRLLRLLTIRLQTHFRSVSVQKIMKRRHSSLCLLIGHVSSQSWRLLRSNSMIHSLVSLRARSQRRTTRRSSNRSKILWLLSLRSTGLLWRMRKAPSLLKWWNLFKRLLLPNQKRL